MTTETINTATPQDIRDQKVNEIIDRAFASDNIKEDLRAQIESLIKRADDAISQNQRLIDDRDRVRKQYNDMKSTITEFLKEHIGDNEDADADDLKELADNLDIKLTKIIKVNFNVECEFHVEVPLDKDDSDIDEDDFDVEISWSGDSDWDVVHETTDINDFNTEEDR